MLVNDCNKYWQQYEAEYEKLADLFVSDKFSFFT